MKEAYAAYKAEHAEIEGQIELSRENSSNSRHIENGARMLKIGSVLVPGAIVGTALMLDVMGGSGMATFTLAGLKAFILANKVPMIAGAVGYVTTDTVERRAGNNRDLAISRTENLLDKKLKIKKPWDRR